MDLETSPAATDTNIDVSIVVCTRDRSSDLSDMLVHLGRTEIPRGWQVELLVVDNGSTDETKIVATRVKLPNLALRYVYEPRRGKARALNTGIEASKGRVLLMTDDDVHVPTNWIEDMCRPILSGEADLVQGGITIASHLERPWLTGVLRTWVAEVKDPAYPPEGLVGANMAVRRTAIDEVGAFDPRLGPGAAGFYEDTVLGWRMENAGYRKLYLPEVAVEHHFQEDRLTIRAFMSSAERMAAARAIVDRDAATPRQRPSIFRLLSQLPGLAARSISQLARMAINNAPDARFMARYYYFVLWRQQRRAGRASEGGTLTSAQ